MPDTITYDLYTILKANLKNGSSDLVTRHSGQLIREAIEQSIAGEKEPAIISLDFSRIGIIDYSCADEVVAKLVSRLLGGEYGDRFITLSGINDNQKENIEVALERKDLAVMAAGPVMGKALLGTLHKYLNETLDLIISRGGLTAKELSQFMGLEANTSGTRLLNLYKKRLVTRMEESGPGGRVWRYEAL